MGVYRCEFATPEAIILRHEGEDDHSIEVKAGPGAPVPQFILDRVKPTGRYFCSLSFTEVGPPGHMEELVAAASRAVDGFTSTATNYEASALPAWASKPDPSRLKPRESDETTA